MRFDLSRPGELALALLPDLALMGGAMLLLIVATLRPRDARHQRTVGFLCMGLLVAALALVGYMAWRGDTAAPGVIAVDNFRWAVDAILLVGALATVALSIEYNEREHIHTPEAHVLVLLATAGMMLLAAGRDMIVVFLGIELASVSVYVLAGLNRRSPKSAEGALKYFLLGAFSTAFLLYGIALVYGATGATDFARIGAAVTAQPTGPLLGIGIALLVVGFGFKVAAAPFHQWAPDVYEGAPTPLTAFMAATFKAAAFAAFLRIFVEAFPSAYDRWQYPLWYLAVLTMFAGNLIALVQRNIKRMLAYSSIAHAGYLLVAVIAGVGRPETGTGAGVVSGSSAFVFYVLAYTLATMGAFAVVSAIGGEGDRRVTLDDYSGLWAVRPGLTLCMSVCMLALLGFPVFGGVGFFAKWYLIQAALRGGLAPQHRLAALLVIASVISAGYYLYVVAVMFTRPRAADAPEPAPIGPLTSGVLVSSVVLILVFGFAPTQLLRGASNSSLRPVTVPLVPGGPAVPLPRLPGAAITGR